MKMYRPSCFTVILLLLLSLVITVFWRKSQFSHNVIASYNIVFIFLSCMMSVSYCLNVVFYHCSLSVGFCILSLRDMTSVLCVVFGNTYYCSLWVQLYYLLAAM